MLNIQRTRRMKVIGLEPIYEQGKVNPLPWTEHWFNVEVYKMHHKKLK